MMRGVRILRLMIFCASLAVAAPPDVVLVGDVPSDARLSFERFPWANPDHEPLVFPPTGTAYRQNGRSHFLWRSLGLRAPDLVVVVGDQDFGLTEALAHNSVAGMGRIPAVHVPAVTEAILRAIPKSLPKSDAHIEHDRRLARSPRDVAEELMKYYGRDFDPAVYIPAMALIARSRFGQREDVVRILAPYLEGAKDSLAKPTPSHLAGHLVFAELGYRDRVRAAADLAATGMSLQTEMSDAVFMDSPILAAAGDYDKALDHIRAMQKLCLRADGLYRHSPLNDAAWGRGNAFPALGVSWALLMIPENHPAHTQMVHDLQTHLAVLARFQDREGMWHEVIDHPESYSEFSATAMIAVAMIRAVRHGWLNRSYQPHIEAAWRGILTRIGRDGELVDVCESTGKQKTLEAYLNRAASLGKDARGGGMALLMASEMLR